MWRQRRRHPDEVLLPAPRLRLPAPLVAFLLLAPSTAYTLDFENLSHGAIVDGEFGTTPVGDVLMGEIGGQALGLITSHDGEFVHQWQGLVTFKAGELATTRPFTTLIGAHGRAMWETGYRVQPQHAWSPYVGVRLGGDLQILVPPGDGLAQLRLINNTDGVGDLNLNGLLRVAVGASYLGGSKSLIVDLFLQGYGRIAEINTPNAGFLDVGVAARFDVAHQWALSLEGLWGTTSSRANAALGLTDVTTHFRVAFDGRKVFDNGMWLGAAVLYDSERDSLGNSLVTYDTRSAPTTDVTLVYGFPLGRQIWRTKQE